MPWTDDQIAQRVARDVEPGWVINLGIGIPTQVAQHITAPGVLVHSENGILGMGPPAPEGEEDPDLVDASKNAVTLVPGAAFMDTLVSFSLIRGGHLDLSLMGAYQVSVSGDLANWRLPDRRVGGIGGAADLAAGAKRVWITMKHTTKTGEPKLIAECTYPLTAKGIVSRIYSDLAVLELDRDAGIAYVLDLAPGVERAEVEAASGVPLEDSPSEKGELIAEAP
jgi:3-oxoacid CoA-transferase B subunit